ncbi:MAG: GreA/GreB family elongation factor [Verrucomicrobia bacterium]|nr:GreA/GreB family elongation factor [Verrucomicrobiota bacterium]
MSKAFTRESDDVPERPELPRRAVVLPPGEKNYITPGGARRIREELERLVEVERPRLAGAPDESDTKQQLQALDQRIHQLHESLQSAEIVGPPAAPWDEVRFGATVTVRDRRGGESRYRIVGIDEADVDRDWVSWLSPIARALLNARLGQHIRFRFPAGEEELEIAGITYE